ncbi:MAG: repeat-containing protein [Phycisphaerales bacterium]|nr:repeat-containing protein [Phycisphaerales bacterium]
MAARPDAAPTQLVPPPAETVEPPRAVHTSNFPDLLRQLNVSLVVTTYQAGKVVLIRAEGDHLNAHFRPFERPMGMAYDKGRLVIGAGMQVWEFFDVPAVAPKAEPVGRHDACFLPRRCHFTGDVDVHEIALDAAGEAWFVNTRFSCLCTLDLHSSFVPRWRPPFVSALAAEDRCHLNGLAMVGGRPRYVTALGQTDAAGGWRANKAAGGLLMDVTTDEVLLRGLSMPHSPRWRDGTLWLQESGDGSVGRVDLDARSYTKICQLPGFTRGMDFAGPVAFVGLSQVRESATFSGLPITRRLSERVCGVYAVHVDTGEVLAFLHFTGGVQEVFAVQVLPDTTYPEMLVESTDLVRHAYVLPDAALADVARPCPAVPAEPWADGPSP